MDILNMFQLHQLINSPPRITETTSSCLDLIITQNPRIIKSIDILQAFCSHHRVPRAVLHQHKHQSHRFKRTIYDYEELDEYKFFYLRLTGFFNRRLNESIFPMIWKTATVTPVYKEGNATLCNNHRPISLLSSVGKVFERCIHKNVYEYLMLNNIITPSESGFLSGESTTNQLLCIYEYLCSNFDKRITTQSVYFNTSKAFDRVWHRGLILKLESIGIRGKC